MSDICSVMLSGRQVNACKYRNNNDNAMASFAIAINRSKKDASGNWVTSTDFFDCKAYGYQADYINTRGGKGADISLSGVLRVEKWEKDGQKYQKVVIVCDSVHIAKCGSSNSTADNNQRGEKATAANTGAEPPKQPDDFDIPF